MTETTLERLKHAGKRSGPRGQVLLIHELTRYGLRVRMTAKTSDGRLLEALEDFHWHALELGNIDPVLFAEGRLEEQLQIELDGIEEGLRRAGS